MIGPLISAGASILGGIMGQKSASDARESTERMAAQNIAMQKEFAQNGIQWKVNDAKLAGIHPIYALGGSTASFAPVSANFSADTSMPNALASAGQDVSRAIHGTRTEADRIGAIGKAAAAIQLEGLQLDNDLKKAEIASKTARLRADQVGPPMPASADAYLVPGQTQSGLIKAKPTEVGPAPSNQPQSEGGAVSDVGYARTSTGWAPVPSKDVKERIEDNLIQEFMWAVRNNLLPTIGFNKSPPPFSPKDGKSWIYDMWRQEYRRKPDVQSKYGYGTRPAGWYIR